MKRIEILITGVSLLITAFLLCEISEAQIASGGGAGVGIAIARSGEDVIVEKVKNGMSADRAKIVEGNVIVSIDGMPMRGRPLDQVEALLNGGAGSEILLTVRSNGGTVRSLSLIREALLDLADPGLPIYLALEKPHDLRPEGGMVCKITDVARRSVVIDCGKNAGVDPRQKVHFAHRADYGINGYFADGRVTKIHDYTSVVNVGGNASAIDPYRDIAITSAWRAERARENTLWRVIARGIRLLDYPSGLPYATIDQLRFDVDNRLERAAVTKMAQRLQDAADMAHSVYRRKLSKGRFRGKSLAHAFKATMPKDVMDFLHFLNTYPDNYVGRDWYLPEVYATWLFNGTPHAD